MIKLNNKLFSFIKKCWLALACLFIAFAILFTCFRALTPLAKQYKGQVEQKLSQVLGHPVQIHNMETSWYWFEPVLKLEKVAIEGPGNQRLKLDKLLVGINIIQSLLHWHIQPGVLFIEDVNLNIYQKRNGWEIDGIGLGSKTSLSAKAFKPVLSWILAQEKIVVKNISALVHLQDGSILPFEKMHLTALNESGRFYLNGEAGLVQTIPTQFSFLADFNISDYRLEEATGKFYVSVSRLMPAQWQALFTDIPYRFYGGEGNVKLWVDVNQGHLKQVQSLVAMRHLMVEQPEDKALFIKQLNANMALNPTEDGWELSGDKIKLVLDGKRWPENKILVRYNHVFDSFNLYLQSFDLDLLNRLSIPWPSQIKALLAVRPYGFMENTQIRLTQLKPELFLTQFKSIGIKGHSSIPGISGLTGALNWQPDQGLVELDTDAILIQPAHQSEILFSKLNTSVAWKTIDQALRVSLDRLVLARSDFVLTANGRLDDATSEERTIQLESLFSMQHGQNWLQSIPQGLLKPKLEHWLTHAIRQIGKASGRIEVNGKLADFPYDKAGNEGSFSIDGYLERVDLKFNEKWPEAKNVNAYLKLTKRDLELDVVQADILDVHLNHANLRMSDIGHQPEVILFRTNSQTSSKNLFELVSKSPLKNRLSKLSMLNLRGPITLDLMMEMPLHPAYGNILTEGEATFLKNQAIVSHGGTRFKLQDLHGKLLFDEKGITQSALKATLLDNEFDIEIHSARGAAPYTEIDLHGQSSVDVLNKRFNWPLLNVMKGEFPIQGKIKISDDTDDVDSIFLESTLNGVAIDLPSPLGKKANIDKPIKLGLNYNVDKPTRFSLSYDDTLSSVLWLSHKHERPFIQGGDIQIGPNKVDETIKKGIQLTGRLNTFDFNAWQSTFEKLSKNTSSDGIVNEISHIELAFGQLDLPGLVLKDLSLEVAITQEKNWDVKIKHKDFKGKLLYQKPVDLLSGHFSHLKIKGFSKSKEVSSVDQFKIKPAQIPNLNLTIDNLTYNDILLGDAIIKAESSKHAWHLDYFKLISPNYQLGLSGEWILKDQKNQTTMQARLSIIKFAESLKLFDIEPVVEAKEGEINFKGSWNGPFYDVSLRKILGSMDIRFKNGRITKLNPQTEEKLGLGKLLSILSLQTIPRRLSLDFSDLSKSGYSFDIFKGTYALKQGVMQTSDSYIDGPVAYASIKGSLDLHQRMYDLNLHVSPHITASLPVVATIAGGPIAGVAAWVASKLINHGMQKISGYTYKITGPWLDPVVQQVSIIKKRAQGQN